MGGVAVEVAGRLVGEDQRGVGDDRARHGDALLLAAGELGRVMAGAVEDADGVERGAGALAARLAGQAGVGERELDLGERAHPRDEVEGLEDEADLVAAQV